VRKKFKFNVAAIMALSHSRSLPTSLYVCVRWGVTICTIIVVFVAFLCVGPNAFQIVDLF